MYSIEAVGLARSVRLPTGEKLCLLRDVRVAVSRGEFVAVVGRSGSGKSTLLALLGLLAQPDAGYVRVNGQDTRRLSDRDRSRMRREHVGFVFQNYSLLPHLTAAENVALALMQGGRVSTRQIRRRVVECLEAVDLAGRAAARPRQLSGGEQQRIAVARALAHAPSVVLADEPTGSLDELTADRVLGLMIGAVRSSGTALVLVTHDREVAQHADRVVLLNNGRIVEAGGTS